MKKQIILVCFIILSFLPGLFGPQEAPGAVLLDRIVATVNEEVITWSELMNSIILDGKQYLQGKTGEAREAKIKEMERPFLNHLIEMKLQLQVAQKMDIDVSQSEVDGAINDISKKYGLTEEVLMNSLKAEGLTMDDYRAKLSDQILLQKVVNAAVRSNVVVSDAEVEQYYEEHRSEFNAEEQCRISQIFFALPKEESQKKELETKAMDIWERIQRGEDFATLAREYSEGPNREIGGDLGFITRGSALKAIEDVAFSLQKGEVSKPFWSPAGLHIIKLEDRIEGGGIDSVRDKIRDTLFQTAFEKKYDAWKKELRRNAYIEIKL